MIPVKKRGVERRTAQSGRPLRRLWAAVKAVQNATAASEDSQRMVNGNRSSSLVGGVDGETGPEGKSEKALRQERGAERGSNNLDRQA